MALVAATVAAQSASVVYTDSWAVVIGINDYQSTRIPKLRYAVSDARSIEHALLAQGFTRDHVIALTDRDATKSRIEAALGDELRTRAGQNDRVFVFFAGHGVTDRLRTGEDEGYLLPVDADPDRLFSTAVSMTALRQISDRLRAKHILYVVDACYSGYALFTRSMSTDLLEEMVRRPAIQILTAGRQGDEAVEKGGHGVFTDVLLRGLQGDAFGDKDWLSLEELGVWVKQRVYAESNKKQVPQFGNLSGEGQFVFLRLGSKGTAGLPRPELTKPGARGPSGNTFRVRALIDGKSVLWVRGNRVWWSHYDFAAPGRHEGRNEPTMINGEAWLPDWPSGELRSGAISRARTFDSFMLPAEHVEIRMDRLQGRGGIRLIKGDGREYTVGIEFDDDAILGSDWYEVVLVW